MVMLIKLKAKLLCCDIIDNILMVEKIKKIIQKIVGDGINFSVTASDKPEFGDYSS